jgi:hypothetical protein
VEGPRPGLTLPEAVQSDDPCNKIAAKACGCTFFPASEAQAQRLAMQRRIFTLDGKPFLATRDGGGFFETHATLALLIDGHMPGREPKPKETAKEAEAADAKAAGEIAAERGDARGGGAQVVPRRSSARLRTPWRGDKRGT